MERGVRVWCLRHGESESNAGLPGAVDDCGLTVRGRQQSVKGAQQLAAERIGRIYCSSLLRARQTADLVATTLAATAGLRNLQIAALPELDEVDCSAEELHTWIVAEDLGRSASDGEAGHKVVARVTGVLQEIAGAHPGETVVAVGHVASLTVTLGRLCSLGSLVWGTALPHAKPFLVEWDGNSWRCPSWPATLPAE